MQSNYKLAVALLVGAAVGALAMQGLHAQAKPPAYVIAESDVTNPDAYLKEFVPAAVKALRDGGAKFLVAGGKTAAIVGEPPKSRIAVVAFEDMDKALAAYSSPAYKEALAIGGKYAKFHFYAIEGVPQ
jgi:uncharacterized protein (DUF1330 family)